MSQSAVLSDNENDNVNSLPEPAQTMTGGIEL